jgi:hypothetical protein
MALPVLACLQLRSLRIASCLDSRESKMQADDRKDRTTIEFIVDRRHFRRWQAHSAPESVASWRHD